MNYCISYIKEFGLKMFVCTAPSRVFRKLRLSQKILDKYDCYKHIQVENFLYSQYKKIVNKEMVETNKAIEINKTGYVFWWQGEQDAPELVKICIKSIRENSGINIIVLSKENLNEYVSLPKYIMQKFKEGKISLPHFSDIIRFNLLYDRGGVWIDATNLMTGKIPDSIFEFSFYSIKDAYKNSLGWKWTSFYMAAKKHDYLCGCMVDFYNQYWKEHDMALTYLFLDCWLTVLYKKNNGVRQEIDSYHSSKLKVFELLQILGNDFSENEYENTCNESYIHKLTYKRKFAEKNNDKLTGWGYLKNQFILK